jgi:hypothetical protein
VLLLAVHWSRVSDVLRQAGGRVRKGHDHCSLPMNKTDTGSWWRTRLRVLSGSRRRHVVPRSSPRSGPCRAKCCSVSLPASGERPDRACSTAAMAMIRRQLPRGPYTRCWGSNR